MRGWTKLLLLSLAALPYNLLGESTVDLYGGYTSAKTSDLSITHYYLIGTPDTYESTFSGNGGTIGVRAIHWLDDDDMTSLDQSPEVIETQGHRFVGFGADLFGFQVKGDNTDAWSIDLALNVMFRYPHETWQPYMGMGLLFHWSNVHVGKDTAYGESVSGSDSGMGMVFQTGLRVSLSREYALFAEYRYTPINFSEDTDTLYFGGDLISADIRASHYLIGFSWAL